MSLEMSLAAIVFRASRVGESPRSPFSYRKSPRSDRSDTALAQGGTPHPERRSFRRRPASVHQRLTRTLFREANEGALGTGLAITTGGYFKTPSIERLVSNVCTACTTKSHRHAPPAPDSAGTRGGHQSAATHRWQDTIPVSAIALRRPMALPKCSPADDPVDPVTTVLDVRSRQRAPVGGPDRF
jgi:hypothetical protein